MLYSIHYLYSYIVKNPDFLHNKHLKMGRLSSCKELYLYIVIRTIIK